MLQAIRSRALLGLLALGLVLGAAPAAGALELEHRLVMPADHGGDDGGGYRSGRDCRDGGGCNNRRREDYGDGSCKYFCPAFDRSPVEDSFNPTICVMPGSCSSQGDERRRGDEEPAPAPGPEPGTMGRPERVPGMFISLEEAPGVATPGASPLSLFPPSPGAVKDFVVATITAGLELGQLFADATIKFVSSLLIGMA